ncbi:MAG: ABC transporter, partial [Pseudomonadota bacterium]|nr:ABC transporter [Pseudomonadota bacterium]
RSFANEPQLILADEPTGNLDNTNAQYVFSLLLNTVKYSQVAALVATHNQDLAKRMDRIIYIDKGKLVES